MENRVKYRDSFVPIKKRKKSLLFDANKSSATTRAYAGCVQNIHSLQTCSTLPQTKNRFSDLPNNKIYKTIHFSILKIDDRIHEILIGYLSTCFSPVSIDNRWKFVPSTKIQSRTTEFRDSPSTRIPARKRREPTDVPAGVFFMSAYPEELQPPFGSGRVSLITNSGRIRPERRPPRIHIGLCCSGVEHGLDADVDVAETDDGYFTGHCSKDADVLWRRGRGCGENRLEGVQD